MTEKFSGEWRSVKLGDVCEILDYMRIPLTANTRKFGKYPYYGANGLQDYVNDYIFDEELVLLAEDGGHFGSHDRPIAYRVSGKCWVNNHAHVLRPKDVINVDYLCYSLMFYDVREFITGTTRQKLTQADMKQITISLPPLDEQIAIADTLSAFDLHLANLSELIAKHEGIRAGALEDLLSGRTRLPGFSGEWRTVKLGEISNYGKAKQVTSDKIPAGSLIVEMEDIEQAGACRLSIKHYDRRPKSAKNKFYPGDVLFGKMRTYLRKSWLADEEGYCSTEIVPFRGNEGVDSKFLMYVMITPQIVNWTKHMSAGMDMPRLGTKEALNLCVTLPPIDEQIAIAETLSALDLNISNLKAEHAKISALRTAAINDLLTAKIRLPC